MSLYNYLFGMNPNTDIILALIGLKRSDIERFRDVSINYEENEIRILTRTGGNNRKNYPNTILIKNPYYLRNKDDSFDSTYAYYYFRIPDEIREDIKGLIEPAKYGISAKLIQHILKTLNRKPTKEDIRYRRVKTAEKTVNRLVTNWKAQLWNGWVIVPLCDSAFKELCTIAEENGGEFPGCYVIRPFQPEVATYETKYKFDDDMYSVVVRDPHKWKIDWKMWNRWEEKYGSMFPKTIKTIKEEVSVLNQRKED